MTDIGERISAGIAAIVGLAVVALVLSNKAQTSQVISAFMGGLSNLIGVAISPVTGQSVSGLSAGLGGYSSSGSSGFLTDGSGSIPGALNLGGLGGLGSIGNMFGGGGGGGGFDIGSMFGGGGGGGGGFDIGSIAGIASFL